LNPVLSDPKFAMGRGRAGVSPTSLPAIFGGKEPVQLKIFTAQLIESNLTFKFEMGEGGWRDVPKYWTRHTRVRAHEEKNGGLGPQMKRKNETRNMESRK